MKLGFKKYTLFILLLLAYFFHNQSMANNYYPNGLFVKGGALFSNMNASGLSLIGSGGGTLLDNSMRDQGTGFMVGAGYQFKIKPIAFDIEYYKRPNVSDTVPRDIQGNAEQNLDSTIRNSSLLFNLFVDIRLGNDYFVPFITAGAGVAQNQTSTTATLFTTPFTVSKASKTIRNFAWQGGGGVRIKLTDNVFISGLYRYVNLGKTQWGPWQSPVGDRTIKTNDFNSNEGLIALDIFFGNQQKPQAPPSLIDD